MTDADKYHKKINIKSYGTFYCLANGKESVKRIEFLHREDGPAAEYTNGQLNQSIANDIRKLRNEGVAVKDLMKQFRVGKSTIYGILNNEYYKN